MKCRLFPQIALLMCMTVCLFASTMTSAQDAVKVDSNHYKVETENAKVRVLRVHYGPHEKSVMHSHPASVAVFLTDGSVRFTGPDGKTQDVQVKAGQTQYTPAQVHNPENIGDKPFEVIVIELKGGPKAASAKPAKK
jgi:quercetin dioxygenase-like cupin family protein